MRFPPAVRASTMPKSYVSAPAVANGQVATGWKGPERVRGPVRAQGSCGRRTRIRMRSGCAPEQQLEGRHVVLPTSQDYRAAVRRLRRLLLLPSRPLRGFATAHRGAGKAWAQPLRSDCPYRRHDFLGRSCRPPQKSPSPPRNNLPRRLLPHPRQRLLRGGAAAAEARSRGVLMNVVDEIFALFNARG